MGKSHDSFKGSTLWPCMLDPFAPLSSIDSYLKDYLESRKLAPHLREALAYSLLAPGKRLRPVLCWHACEALGAAVGVKGHESLPAGGAVELIHCFSLIHDDLPALDNDDLRRGRPTLHKHAGEAMAILAGDLAHTLAFLLISERCPAGLAPQMVTELAAATQAMIVGQVYDTLGGVEGSSLEEQAEKIHANKTGALIRASCRLGILSACGAGHLDAPQQELELARITRYADALGLIFQITDDLLDVEQTAEHVGKKTGKDAAAGKVTYPAVFGVEGSRREIAKHEELAIQAIAPWGEAAKPLHLICQQMSRRTK